MAIFNGLIAFIIISSVALAILYSNPASNIGILAWVAIFISGAITAFKAQSKKILWSLVLALLIAPIIAIENWVWQLLGKPSDLPGLQGFLIIIGMYIPFGLVLSGAGGILGWFIWKQKNT